MENMNNEHNIRIDSLPSPDRGRAYDAVVFDVDSTLVTMEGLDWLAEYKGLGKGISALTHASMDGQMDFGDAMKRKMQKLAPSYQDLKLLGYAYRSHIVPGVLEVIAALQKRGIEVWILTGNFQPAVGILAEKLGIVPEHVICNTVFFNKQNEYAGFDENNPLSKNGGKAIKIQEVLNRAGKQVVFVGDGMTDLEVQDKVALFIGFGGVVKRNNIKERAHRYIDKRNLLPVLDIVLGENDPKLTERPAPHQKRVAYLSGLTWKRMGGTYM